MSGLLSSLVQPVVRQARRFSGVAGAADSGDDRLPAPTLSHAREVDANSDLDDVTTAAAHESVQTPANFPSFEDLRNRLPRPEVIARLRRLVSAPAAPTTSSTSREPWGVYEEGAHAHRENAGTHFPNFHDERVAREEREMSYNPSYGIPDRFRSSDTLSSMQSLQSSNVSTPAGGRSRRNTGRLSMRQSNARNTPRPLGEAYDPSLMSGTLPEDDGMADLRRKIHEIRDMAASSEEKAKRMHQLMTAEYAVHAPLLRPSSPASMMSAERPFTPSSPGDDMIVTPATSPPMATSPRRVDPSNPFNITPADLQPSFRPLPEPNLADGAMDEDQAEPEYGCAHYKRNVKVQCFDCRQWYPCRHCHDAQSNHKLDRKKTENMLCMLCQTPQQAGQACISCGADAACYYCGICKLWDDDSSKRIYHCPDCGICRRGEGLGKDYVHCKRCNVCITISHHSSHRCIERATECDCPICNDYMFTSSLSVSALPCGHYMHKTCYQQYMAVSYKCPICQRSAVNMELQWRKLDNAIESQPMPAQFQDTKAVIQCNDCGEKCVSRYHWLGNKCGNCDSYNTSEIRLLGGNEVEDVRRRLPRQASLTGTGAQLALQVARRDSTRTMDERNLDARSPRATQASSPGNRSPTSYFLNEPEDRNQARRDSSSTLALPSAGILMSPVELLQRVSRSLSPMRHYLEFRAQHAEQDGAADDDDDEAMDFWGGDARSGNEDEDEDEEWEDEDSNEDMESGDEDMESEEEDDENEGRGPWEGLELIGHR